jgi:hypothetical protein
VGDVSLTLAPAAWESVKGEFSRAGQPEATLKRRLELSTWHSKKQANAGNSPDHNRGFDASDNHARSA